MVATELQARQPRNCDSVSGKDKILQWHWCLPSLLYNGYLVGAVFPGVKLTVHLHLLPRSRMCGAILPLPHMLCLDSEESAGHVGCVIEDVTMLLCLNTGLLCLSLPCGPRCIGALFLCWVFPCKFRPFQEVVPEISKTV